RQFFWCLRSRFVTSDRATTKRSSARCSVCRASLTSTPRPAAAQGVPRALHRGERLRLPSTGSLRALHPLGRREARQCPPASEELGSYASFAALVRGQLTHAT